METTSNTGLEHTDILHAIYSMMLFVYDEFLNIVFHRLLHITVYSVPTFS